MTLLITLFAAVTATVKWYTREDDTLRLGTLCFMYWGASLMWTVDAAFEYAELGAKFFTPELPDMINDAYLGLYVVALGLVIWIVRLLIADPRGTVRRTLARQSA
ncbi:MAG: hypothetical protein J6Z30_05490 [Pyramidobacter sp.]|nr:hypothetical protein [Pyramidobacter sp.]